MPKRNFFFIALFSFLLVTPFVKAHFLGFSAVDEGEIRWGGSTTYATQWSGAVTKWNALDPINILPDTASTYEDLKISDVNLPDATYYGKYEYYSVGTDKLKFNTAKLGIKTSSMKQYVILHELGHALGFNHSFIGNVMYVGESPHTTLGPHDIEDYNNLY